MNKQGKNGIGWCDFTWNPVVGCKNGCPYCYAKRVFNRFHKVDKFTDIHFHPERLDDPLRVKKPSKIFVGSMTDLFAKWASKDSIEYILDIVKKCPQHTFMFLTKNPLGYKRIRKYPKNCWLGVTVTRARYDWAKAAQMCFFKRDNIKFVSIEPILEPIDTAYFWMHDWIILGGLTPRPVHKQKWIKDFLDIGRLLTKPPVFMKSNLNWKGKLRQEFPKEVK